MENPKVKQQWSTEETSYLLGIWSSQEVQRKLEGSTRSKAMFQHLQREMATAGYDRTVEQICNKLKKVKKDYWDQKRDLGRSGSGHPKTSPHYDLLDSVLGDRPTSGFGSTVNSLSLESIVLDETMNVRSSSDAVKSHTTESGRSSAFKRRVRSVAHKRKADSDTTTTKEFLSAMTECHRQWLEMEQEQRREEWEREAQLRREEMQQELALRREEAEREETLRREEMEARSKDSELLTSCLMQIAKIISKDPAAL
ncbi:uncharacterized protein LOC117468965 isoform X1 [Trematomus bernacchii]|uniref:uncharacterized protein LOC117468965 isoform X1 n=1 Tax=Trematomus bernacchii TaxID=40690 RepID=UPI00146B6507|nr:uncharacterized protein LOC117468965 isoform X1 [Trematomus bernacchii]